MRAMIYTGPGGPEAIALVERPDLEPGPREIRVRVRAAGLNRADLLQRRGGYAAPEGWPADVPGLEYAGEVDRLGSAVSRWREGDRVMGLVGGGAHAEQVVVHEEEALAVPPHAAWTDAAAIPEAFLTGFDALVVRARVQPGERVLLHAVGSGLGTATLQLARWLGATVVGTSRTADKLTRCRDLGLDEGVLTSGGFRHDQLVAPVDVIIDVLGGPAFAENLAALAPRGRLVLLGFLQGPDASGSLSPVLRKRLEVIGSVMRSRSLEERIPLCREFASRVLPAFGGPTPALRPIVDSVLPMTALAEAHRLLEGNAPSGKVVLTWPAEPG